MRRFAASRARLEAFRHTDPIEEYADLLAFAVGYRKGRGRDSMPAQRSLVKRVHIGSGKDYKPGWLNLDVLASALQQYDAILSRFTDREIAPPDPALRSTDPIAPPRAT